MEIRARSVGRQGEPLTLRAPLHIFINVFEHLGPVISLVDGFVGETPSTCVVSTVVVVDFPHHILGSFWPEAHLR